MKKIFIITGELSGDLHAAKVVEQLKKQCCDVEIEAVGGDNLKRAGAKIFANHEKMSSVGLSFEIVKNHFILGKKILNHLKTNFKADSVLLVDYGAFNLKMAKYLKKEGFKVHYFIAPQIWASRKYRINAVKKYVDEVFTIFPFETKLYSQNNIKSHYVGHPLSHAMPVFSEEDKVRFFEKYNLDSKKKLVSIFPGSRKFEIEFLLETFLKSAKEIEKTHNNVQFVLCQAPSIKDNLILPKVSKYKNIKILKGENYPLLKFSDALILASGTVALEAALYETPMVISYKAPWLFWFIYLMVRCIKMVSLPNIILNKKVIKELLQNHSNKKEISEEISTILDDQNYRNKMKNSLKTVKSMLSEKNCAEEVAKMLLKG